MARKRQCTPIESGSDDLAWPQESLRSVIGYQLTRASLSTLRVFFESVGEALALRPVEFTLLCLIDEAPGVSARQLARTLAVSPPNITHWLDRLMARGFVMRRQNLVDGRTLDLHLTPDGARTAQVALQALHQREAVVFASLSVGEKAMLMELLGKLVRGASAASG